MQFRDLDLAEDAFSAACEAALREEEEGRPPMSAQHAHDAAEAAGAAASFVKDLFRFLAAKATGRADADATQLAGFELLDAVTGAAEQGSANNFWRREAAP